MQSTTLLVPEGDWSNEPREIEAYRWLVRYAKGFGVLVVRHLATSKVQHEPVDVCAEDTCRCWTVLAADSSGADE